MALTHVEKNTKTIITHFDTTSVLTIDFSQAPSGHNFIQFTNLDSASRAVVSIYGAPTVATNAGLVTMAEGFVVPPSTVNGGVRMIRYENQQFVAWKALASASGGTLGIEVSKSSAELTAR